MTFFHISFPAGWRLDHPTRSTDHGTTGLWAIFSGATNPVSMAHKKIKSWLFGLLFFNFPLWTCCFFGSVAFNRRENDSTSGNQFSSQSFKRFQLKLEQHELKAGKYISLMGWALGSPFTSKLCFPPKKSSWRAWGSWWLKEANAVADPVTRFDFMLDLDTNTIWKSRNFAWNSSVIHLFVRPSTSNMSSFPSLDTGNFFQHPRI